MSSSNPDGINEALCFVMMPFDQRFDKVYSVIENVVSEYAGCRCMRADLIAKPNQITEDIFTQIRHARFLVADLTGHNPNVFYEVGFAHALEKKVVLLLQTGCTAPFDIHGIRYLAYSQSELNKFRAMLKDYVKGCLQTLPDRWRKESTSGRPDVRITHLDYPEHANVNEAFRIVVHARNFGDDARQGYVSLSFPSDVADLKIVHSDLQSTVGKKGEKWRAGQAILRYPIAEMVAYAEENQISWRRNISYSLSLEVTPSRCGLLQFYVSTSSEARGQWSRHPRDAQLRDHRDLAVYCAVVEVE